MAEFHTTIVGGAGWLKPGRNVINDRLPEVATALARPLRAH
jgi:hypothetical protein